MKTITVTFDGAGGATIETSGYTGTACQDATRGIEKALGVKVSDTPTAEANIRIPARGVAAKIKSR